MTGQTGYYSGLCAEDTARKHYELAGLKLVQQRWRGRGGEIDLILRNSSGIVFVEVKKSKSIEQAAARLRPKQIERLYCAASEFLESEPKGQLTDCRFDVALVDGQGRLQIVENALAA